MLPTLVNSMNYTKTFLTSLVVFVVYALFGAFLLLAWQIEQKKEQKKEQEPEPESDTSNIFSAGSVGDAEDENHEQEQEQKQESDTSDIFSAGSESDTSDIFSAGSVGDEKHGVDDGYLFQVGPGGDAKDENHEQGQGKEEEYKIFWKRYGVYIDKANSTSQLILKSEYDFYNSLLSQLGKEHEEYVNFLKTRIFSSERLIGEIANMFAPYIKSSRRDGGLEFKTLSSAYEVLSKPSFFEMILKSIISVKEMKIRVKSRDNTDDDDISRLDKIGYKVDRRSFTNMTRYLIVRK